MDYKQSGVDIEAGYEVVSRVKKLSKSTFVPGVLGEIGLFGGLFQIDVNKYKEPVLVSGTDGVGTKLKIAFLTGVHNTIGIDAVAMSVNDVIVQGAKPLFFLDYLAFNKVDPNLAEQILIGIADGCKQSGCALIGGETAEMGDLYGKNEYDIAGFCVGVVDKSKIIDGSKIKEGDKLVGIASSGLHSNGYSLARKVLLEMGNLNVADVIPSLGTTLGNALLTPTILYVNTILSLIDEFEINGMAHITGGGLPENVARILPKGTDAMFEASSWPKPAIYDLIQKTGEIATGEMYKAFNMGLGMVLAVNPLIADKVIAKINQLGNKAFLVGEIVKGSGNIIIK